MITVACVLKSGGIYTAEWVDRLRIMVERHLSLAHNFVCLSDMDVPGIETIPLVHQWPGWWSKLELFGPALWDVERALYLDLDVLVTGVLDSLVNQPHPMIIAPAIITKPKPKMVRRYQSSVMCWTPPEGREIYEDFCPEVHMKNFHGDQDWIGFVKPDCAMYPPTWFSKRQMQGVKVVLNYKAEPRLSSGSGSDLERASS